MHNDPYWSIVTRSQVCSCLDEMFLFHFCPFLTWTESIFAIQDGRDPEQNDVLPPGWEKRSKLPESHIKITVTWSQVQQICPRKATCTSWEKLLPGVQKDEKTLRPLKPSHQTCDMKGLDDCSLKCTKKMQPADCLRYFTSSLYISCFAQLLCTTGFSYLAPWHPKVPNTGACPGSICVEDCSSGSELNEFPWQDILW